MWRVRVYGLGFGVVYAVGLRIFWVLVQGLKVKFP